MCAYKTLSLRERMVLDLEGTGNCRAPQIVRIRGIDVHPDADRLVILRLNVGVDVVAGPHYEEGQLGVYIPAPVIIPGWLAEDLWMVKKGDRWVVVEPRIMRGVPSPGIFCGQRWRNSPQSP